MLQSKAGYIDARPLTAGSTNHLQRAAGPYIGVKAGHLNQADAVRWPSEAASSYRTKLATDYSYNLQAEAERLEHATDEAIAACGGDLWATVKALIVAVGFLEAEMERQVSHGFRRGVKHGRFNTIQADQCRTSTSSSERRLTCLVFRKSSRLKPAANEVFSRFGGFSARSRGAAIVYLSSPRPW
jgi:hypothetical protein